MVATGAGPRRRARSMQQRAWDAGGSSAAWSIPETHQMCWYCLCGPSSAWHGAQIMYGMYWDGYRIFPGHALGVWEGLLVGAVQFPRCGACRKAAAILK